MGANPYQSVILSKRLRGSNILTGRDILMTLWPDHTFDAA